MPTDNEASQMRPWYDDRGFSRINEPGGGGSGRGQQGLFDSRDPQQQYAPSIQHQYSAQGYYTGFSSGSVGGAQGFMSAGVPTAVQDPPPNAVPVPPPNALPINPGMEIVMPDPNGVQQKYKIQYACYLVSRDEAKEYVERFGDCPVRVGPPPVLQSGARPMR
jgi:hypothetical protein